MAAIGISGPSASDTVCFPDCIDDSSEGLPNKSMRDGFRDIVQLNKTSSSFLLPKGSGGGGSSSSSGSQAAHPLERIQTQSIRKSENARMARAAAMFGLHMPLKMKMERELLCQTQRLPGGPKSSLWGLEMMMGRDDEIDVSDYLNPLVEGPENPLGAACSVHDVVERHFLGGC